MRNGDLTGQKPKLLLNVHYNANCCVRQPLKCSFLPTVIDINMATFLAAQATGILGEAGNKISKAEGKIQLYDRLFPQIKPEIRIVMALWKAAKPPLGCFTRRVYRPIKAHTAPRQESDPP